MCLPVVGADTTIITSMKFGKNMMNMIETKNCLKCNIIKPINEFNLNKSKKDGYQIYCRDCTRKTNNYYYNSNEDYRKKIIVGNRNRKRKVVEWFREFKTTLKCDQCDENHPSTLDFHHLDPAKKDINISEAAGEGYSIEKMKREINKCIILCANCHRKLHWNEKMDQ